MPTEPEKLKREQAGRYASADGRFVVEQDSGRWMLVDAESTDDLGLPLVRGPFETLDDARTAVAEARTAPKPTSSLAGRITRVPKRAKGAKGSKSRPAEEAVRAHEVEAGRADAREADSLESQPREPQIELRDLVPGDGAALRALWKAAGFGSSGDDDRSLAELALRNPSLLVVATADGTVIGSALGTWDGRRGSIYHLAVAAPFRRKGIATRLVRRVEQRLRVAGAPKTYALVPSDNESAREFWRALGYEQAPTIEFARSL